MAVKWGFHLHHHYQVNIGTKHSQTEKVASLKLPLHCATEQSDTTTALDQLPYLEVHTHQVH